jgi:hypothetical protein
MANAGLYYVITRNDQELPSLVHQVWPGTEEGAKAAFDRAWELFESAKGRIPFAVAELRLGVISPPLPDPLGPRVQLRHPDGTFKTTEEIQIEAAKIRGDL